MKRIIILLGICLFTCTIWADWRGMFDAHYFSSTPREVDPILASLVAYWACDVDATDYSGNANHGTAVGATINTNGIVGSAYDFDGSSYIQVPDSSSLKTLDAITISLWVKYNARTDWTRLIEKGTNGVNYSVLHQHTGSSAMYFLIYDSDGNYKQTPVISPQVETGVWAHVVSIYDGTSGAQALRLYLNGTLKCTKDGTGKAIKQSTGALHMGCNETGEYKLNGLLDEVTIWSRVLTTNEILYLYNEGSGVSLRDKF